MSHHLHLALSRLLPLLHPKETTWLGNSTDGISKVSVRLSRVNFNTQDSIRKKIVWLTFQPGIVMVDDPEVVIPVPGYVPDGPPIPVQIVKGRGFDEDGNVRP